MARIPLSSADSSVAEPPQPAPPSSSPTENLKRLLSVPTDIIDSLTYKLKYLPEINYKQACEYADKGLLKDAVFRLKVVLWLAPNHARAHYVMGACYFALGKKVEAITAFREALRLDPESDETLFMLATIDEKLLTPEQRPATIPAHMARDYFDKLAESYETEQRELRYQGHVLMDGLLRQFIDTKQINHMILELGCGTGLCGSLIQDIAGHLTGVDFSRRMLDKAMDRTRKDGQLIYDRTLLRDIRDYVQNIRQASFEVVLASHVFNYVGALEDVFAGVSRSLQPDGLFLFSVEPFEGEHFGVIPTLGRFGHSEHYIAKLAAQNGLEIRHAKAAPVYPDYPLMQYVLQKSQTHTLDEQAG